MFKKKKDAAKKQEQEMLGESSLKSTPTTNILATCSKVYPDFYMAKVESAELGTRVFPYTPDSGIRAGTTVIITISGNTAKITDKLRNLVTPSKAVIIDFDAKQDEKKKFIRPLDSSPDWSDKLGEKMASQPVIVKHEEGEKIFHVDFAGLKVGYKKVVLFYHTHARIELMKHVVEIIGVSTNILSKAGTKKFVFDDKTRESGYILENVYESKDEEYFHFIREYKGNVKKAMSDDKVSFDDVTPKKASSVIQNAVYLFFVIDTEDSDDYDKDAEEVKHTYKNRKLKVESGANSNSLSIHSKIKSKAEISDDFMESKAIKVKIDSEDYKVTYLKAIDVKGNVFEHFAGDRIQTIRGDYYSLRAGDDDSTYHLMDKKEYVQKNVRELHYPVDEKSSHEYEYFGNIIERFKGDYRGKFFRYNMTNFIFTYFEYEVDDKSGIDTMEMIKSPKMVEERQNRITEFKKTDIYNKDKNISDLKTIEGEGGGKTTLIMDAKKTPFSLTYTSKDANTKIIATDQAITMQSKESMNFKTKNMLIDVEMLTITGIVSITKGLFVDSTFFVEAKNIAMTAKETFVITSKNYVANADEYMSFSFADGLSMSGSKSVKRANGKGSGITPMLQLSPSGASMIGENVTVFGGQSLSAIAQKTAAYGAESASIFGLGCDICGGG